MFGDKKLTEAALDERLDAILASPRAHWFVQKFESKVRGSCSTDCHQGQWSHRCSGKHRSRACPVQVAYWVNAQRYLDHHIWELRDEMHGFGWPAAVALDEKGWERDSSTAAGTALGILAATIWGFCERMLASEHNFVSDEQFLEFAQLLVGAFAELEELRTLQSEYERMAEKAGASEGDTTEDSPYLERIAYAEQALATGKEQLLALVQACELARDNEALALASGELAATTAVPLLPDTPNSVRLQALRELAASS
jgi:hypothetical protein